MSKIGKKARPVLFEPKKVAGISLKHRLATVLPGERAARREKNKAKKISQTNHRRRRPHGR
jgi:hypothetical protein